MLHSAPLKQLCAWKEIPKDALQGLDPQDVQVVGVHCNSTDTVCVFVSGHAQFSS